MRKTSNQHQTNPFELKSLSREQSQQQIDEQFYLSHDSPINRPPPIENTINQYDVEEMLLKISELNHQLILQGEKLFYYEDLARKLLIENEELHNNIVRLELQKKNTQNLVSTITEQNSQLLKKKQEVDSLSKRIEELKKKTQQEQMKENVINNAKNPKNEEVKKLQRRNRELKKINKLLEEDLRQSTIKIVQLEKQLQNSTCYSYASNLSRLRESTMPQDNQLAKKCFRASSLHHRNI